MARNTDKENKEEQFSKYDIPLGKKKPQTKKPFKKKKMDHSSFYAPYDSYKDMMFAKTHPELHAFQKERFASPLMKMEVSESTHPCEIEADNVAEKIVNMSETDIQQKNIAGNETIQAKGESGGTEVSPEMESEFNNIRGGKPLSETEQNYYGSRFGENFSGVKIHDDSKAHMLAANLNARAFTMGNDIVFGEGERTHDTAGKKLMAHELTHVVQQNRSIQRKVIQLTPSNEVIPPVTLTLTYQEYESMRNNAHWENQTLSFTDDNNVQDWMGFLNNRADGFHESNQLNLFMAAALGIPQEAIILSRDGNEIHGYETTIRNIQYNGPTSGSELDIRAKRLMKALLLANDPDLADTFNEGSRVSRTNTPRILSMFCQRYMGQVLSEMNTHEMNQINIESFINLSGFTNALISARDTVLRYAIDLVDNMMHGRRGDVFLDNINQTGRVIGRSLKFISDSARNNLALSRLSLNILLSFLPATSLGLQLIRIAINFWSNETLSTVFSSANENNQAYILFVDKYKEMIDLMINESDYLSSDNLRAIGIRNLLRDTIVHIGLGLTHGYLHG